MGYHYRHSRQKARRKSYQLTTWTKQTNPSKTNYHRVAVCKIDNPNSPISYQDNEIHNLKPPQRSIKAQDGFIGFKESLKDKLSLILQIHSPQNRGLGTFPFILWSITLIPKPEEWHQREHYRPMLPHKYRYKNALKTSEKQNWIIHHKESHTDQSGVYPRVQSWIHEENNHSNHIKSLLKQS